MSETETAEALAFLAEPRHICEQTIRTEEQNLAHVHALRATFALPATMGDRHAQEQAKILDRSEARILRRLKLARIALEQLERTRSEAI